MSSIYSIIVPVYHNEETIEPLLERLTDLADRLHSCLEVVFVVDGSPDRSYELLQQHLPQCSFPSQLVRLSRNFGSFAAVRMGLSYAQGEYIATMAADLQEPAELVLDFFEALEHEPVDLVLGTRQQRLDSWTTRTTSGAFWSIYRLLVQPDMPAGGVDVFGCNRQVRDAVLQLNETHSSLVSQLIWFGFRRKEIGYVREKRTTGRSGWSFRKKWRYMTDSVYSFTNLPIFLITLSGIVGCLIAATVAVVVFVAWSLGHIPVPGYTPIMLAVMFSTFMLQASIGVVGNYVWRAFENSKQRPTAVPDSHDRFTRECSDERLPTNVLDSASLQRLTYVRDLRGSLAAAECEAEIPFPVKRCFFIYNVPGKETRGEHAHRQCKQFLVCVQGSVRVLLDNATSQAEVRLDAPNCGLYIPPMMWAAQFEYSRDAVLAVFASQEYDSADYIRSYDDFLALRQVHTVPPLDLSVAAGIAVENTTPSA